MNLDEIRYSLKELKDDDALTSYKVLNLIELIVNKLEEAENKRCSTCCYRNDCDYSNVDNSPLWEGCRGYVVGLNGK